MVTLSARQVAVADLVQEGKCSQRKACILAAVPRSTVRYKRRRALKDKSLRRKIKTLASRHQRYGYRRVAALLRRQGTPVNVKRVHRLWKEMGLGLRQKRPKRRQYGPRGQVLHKAEHPNHVWTYDFVEDRTQNGGRIRMLCVVDEFTRQCLALEAAPRINAHGVLQTLDWLFLVHGRPGHLRSDNGPEFISHAVQDWLHERGAQTLYIKPGSPWENAYIESFNGKLRSECLNMEIFKNVKEAQDVLDIWRKEYNEQRPHSSLNYRTPTEFAAHCCNSSRPTASLRSSNEREAPQTMVILST